MTPSIKEQAVIADNLIYDLRQTARTYGYEKTEGYGDGPAKAAEQEAQAIRNLETFIAHKLKKLNDIEQILF